MVLLVLVLYLVRRLREKPTVAPLNVALAGVHAWVELPNRERVSVEPIIRVLIDGSLDVGFALPGTNEAPSVPPGCAICMEQRAP